MHFRLLSYIFLAFQFISPNFLLDQWALYIVWSENVSHSVNEKSEAKMAAIDVQ
jgi:hypothetical protein